MPADLQGLVDGQSCYTMLTNDAGGIVDDLIVTRLAADTFGLVVNAAARDEVLGGIASAVAGRATLEHDDDRALLALQGPAAVDVLANPEATALRFMTTADLMIGGVACRVTRSGYTGEDGYEISVDAASVVDLAAHLLQDERVELAGLGARDSLRLEAGLCLYGQDIDTNTTPVEAGLAWTIAARRRSAGGFPGHARIAEQLNVGAPRRRVGIRPDGRAPAREGTLVRDDAGRSLGVITSGGFGPTVGGPVSMGYVETASAAPKTAVTLDVRGKAHAAHVVDLPFVPHRYFRG